MLVLDYSAGKPGAAAIKASDYVGAVRYIGFPTRTKCTNRTELADFTANGLGMALVYQDDKGDWRGGYNTGRTNARRGRDHADAIGFPAGRPIYMAVDDDVVTEAEFRAVIEYIRGAATELGGPHLTGPYGEYDVCARVAEARVGEWFWQCRAWSGTPIRYFPGRHLFQRVGTVHVGGIGCDINDVLKPDWGQHNAEDDMDLADRLPPVKLSNGNEYSLTIADVLRGMAQYIAGQGAATAPLTSHPMGQYVSRVLAITDINEKVTALPEQLEMAVAEAVANYLAAHPPQVTVDNAAIAAAVVAEFKKEGN